MVKAIEKASPLFQDVPIHLSRYGLYVWEVEPANGK
jgi:hypothetical protein